jgi:hypothetical protein
MKANFGETLANVKKKSARSKFAIKEATEWNLLLFKIHDQTIRDQTTSQPNDSQPNSLRPIDPVTKRPRALKKIFQKVG